MNIQSTLFAEDSLYVRRSHTTWLLGSIEGYSVFYHKWFYIMSSELNWILKDITILHNGIRIYSIPPGRMDRAVLHSFIQRQRLDTWRIWNFRERYLWVWRFPRWSCCFRVPSDLPKPGVRPQTCSKRSQEKQSPKAWSPVTALCSQWKQTSRIAKQSVSSRFATPRLTQWMKWLDIPPSLSLSRPSPLSKGLMA